MTDRKALADQNETPEDVATLYSWANLHGAKYRDFSAARAQTREKARQRVQQALEEQREQERAEAEALRAEQLHSAAQQEELARREQLMQEQAVRQEAARQAAQLAAQHTAQQAAQLAAQQAANMAAQQAADRQAQEAAERRMQEARSAEQLRASQFAAEQAQAARHAAEEALAAQRAAEYSREAQQAAEQARAVQLAAEQARSVQRAAQEAQAAEQALEQIRAAQRVVWQQPQTESLPAPPAPVPAASTSFFAAQSLASAPPPPPAPRSSPNPATPGREVQQVASPPGWGTAEMQDAASRIQEAATRPAWLNAGHPAETPSASPVPPDDTLQGQRDRMTSRWYALKTVFQGAAVPAEPAPAPAVARAPVLAFFSLAGGVGKTSLAATLGRALSARGERVLLVDTAPFGLLPFYFGARDQRPGQVRTFTPPGASGDAPVQMVTLDPDGMGPEASAQDALSAEIGKYAAGVGRVIVDLATASGTTARRVLQMSPLVLVPVTADMNSVVSIASIDAFFQRAALASSPNAQPMYVLNQFDTSLPLHLDVREVLREQLGDRLLPFALRRSPAVSEALAEGMTVVDYAPNSTVAEDFANLAGWVKSQSAPASSNFRGVRWSER